MLPKAAQERFPSEPELLVEMINRAVGEGDPASDVQAWDNRQSEPAKPSEERSGMFALSQSSQLRHDFTITFITAIAFAVVLFVSRWLLGL